jgi:low temperature requirement protein LtrA
MNDLLRPRHGHASEKVSFVELFFDLVFVFAITQLSHSLIGHFSALGALQTLMLLLAVWWVWVFTAWVTNWLDPEKLPVRCLLLVMMVVGLVLSAAIPGAFGSRGLAFAGAYVTMQLGRTSFFLWAARGEAGILPTFQRIICWLATGSVLWIIGGFLEGSVRMACWGVALLVEYVSPAAGFYVPGLGKSKSTDWQVSGHHMAERCGLFIIIALGESILVTGATFSSLEWTTPLIAAFTASVIGSIAMWWLYFDTASDFGTHVISSSENPGHLARLAYTYLHLFLVTGIILSAAADEFVLAHPTGHTDGKTAIALLGGAALYLLGNVLFKKAIFGRTPWSHLVAVAALGVLGAAAGQLAPWLLGTLTAVVLVAVAWWERHSRCLRED